jgi:phosphoribosyl-AMP cyclohydrolase
MKQENIFNIIKLDAQGLISAVVQDAKSSEILMVAFMHEEALKITLQTGFGDYFSRSRQKLWKKGEISGQVQKVEEILVDCDGDAVILKITQQGEPVGVACHTGRKSCFFRTVSSEGDLKLNQEVLVSKEELYGKD